MGRDWSKEPLKPRYLFALKFDDGTCYVGYTEALRSRIRVVRRMWPDDPDPRVLVLGFAGDYIGDAIKLFYRWRWSARAAGFATRITPTPDDPRPTTPERDFDGNAIADRQDGSPEPWPSFAGAPTVPFEARNGTPAFVYPADGPEEDDMHLDMTKVLLPTKPSQQSKLLDSNPLTIASRQAPQVTGPVRIVYAMVMFVEEGTPDVIVRSAEASLTDVVRGAQARLGKAVKTAQDDMVSVADSLHAPLYAIELERHTGTAGARPRIKAWLAAAKSAGCRLAFQEAPEDAPPNDLIWPTTAEIRASGLPVVAPADHATAAMEPEMDDDRDPVTTKAATISDAERGAEIGNLIGWYLESGYFNSKENLILLAAEHAEAMLAAVAAIEGKRLPRRFALTYEHVTIPTAEAAFDTLGNTWSGPALLKCIPFPMDEQNSVLAQRINDMVHKAYRSQTDDIAWVGDKGTEGADITGYGDLEKHICKNVMHPDIVWDDAAADPRDPSKDANGEDCRRGRDETPPRPQADETPCDEPPPVATYEGNAIARRILRFAYLGMMYREWILLHEATNNTEAMYRTMLGQALEQPGRHDMIRPPSRSDAGQAIAALLKDRIGCRLVDAITKGVPSDDMPDVVFGDGDLAGPR